MRYQCRKAHGFESHREHFLLSIVEPRPGGVHKFRKVFQMGNITSCFARGFESHREHSFCSQLWNPALAGSSVCPKKLTGKAPPPPSQAG